MRIRLVVASGSGKGKIISVSVSPFVIGRNPVCQLRPASALVSDRHCTIWQRKGTGAYVQDMTSTNGTFVNGERITSERAIRNGDRFQVGPLRFDVQIEASVAVNQPTPPPHTKGPAKGLDQEDAAVLILCEDKVSVPVSPGREIDDTGIPKGPTVMGMPVPPAADVSPQDANKKSKAATNQKAKEDTASAAHAIYTRYMRRPQK